MRHDPIRVDQLLPMAVEPTTRPWLDRTCIAIGTLAFAAVPGRALVTYAWWWFAG